MWCVGVHMCAVCVCKHAYMCAIVHVLKICKHCECVCFGEMCMQCECSVPPMMWFKEPTDRVFVSPFSKPTVNKISLEIRKWLNGWIPRLEWRGGGGGT